MAKLNSCGRTPRSRKPLPPGTNSYRDLVKQLPAAERPLLDPDGPAGSLEQNKLIVRLPEPHALLHAHNKGSWHAKHNIVKVLRWKAKKACQDLETDSWPAATIEYFFFLNERTYIRDEANLVQSQKPAIDGIVDAKVIPDDSVKYLHIVGIWCGVDTENPRVEIVLNRATVKKLETLRNKLLASLRSPCDGI